MLFHPKEPRYILGIRFHGIFPKRQRQFAEKLGKLVSEQLLSFQDIEQKITHPENLKKIMPQVEEHIDHFLRVKLAEQMPVISMFIGDKTISELKSIFTKELETLFPVIMQKYMGSLQDQLVLQARIDAREPRRGAIARDRARLPAIDRPHGAHLPPRREPSI